MKNRVKTFSIVVFIIFSIIIIFSYSADRIFTYAYESENYDFAKAVQMWKLNSRTSKMKIKEFVLMQIDNCYKEFKDEKITYEEALSKIEIAGRFYENIAQKRKIINLQKSRVAFENGVKYEKNNNIYEAIIEYMKVIVEDKNYQTAKKQIEENKNYLKSESISKLEEYSVANNYSDALKLISNMEKIFQNDIKFKKYKDKFLFLKKIAECDLTKTTGIEQYLNLKYSNLKSTPIGDINFNISVLENNNRMFAYDYRIDIKFSSFSQYIDLVNSIKYEKNDRVKTDQMLQKHMQALANDILGKLPNKKFEGSYYERDTGMYYLWYNYNDWLGDYDNTSPSYMRWDKYCPKFSD